MAAVLRGGAPGVRLSQHGVDWRDNTLCRFDDLAGIQAQIFAEAGRQDLHARPQTPVTADRDR